MKKVIFLMSLMGAALTSCNHDYGMMDNSETIQAKYEAAFIKKFGQPDPNHTWGFGDATRSVMTRSAVAPAVLGINAPYTEEWVAKYLTTAKEPNSANIADNYDNTKAGECQWYANGGGKLDKLISFYRYGNQSDAYSPEDKEWADNNIKGLLEKYEYWNWNVTSADAYSILKKLQEYKSDDPNYDYKTYWSLTVNKDGGLIPDETFVRNFKITGTWDGNISVLATEGLTDGVANGNERTVVVTGKWNMAAYQEQRVGSKGRIIVAKGGEINIPAGCNLNSVNEAQIVVLPGGKITGDGSIAFHNGTDSNLPSYNGGTIDVKNFNNNGGDFFNYGILKAETMDGGAGNSHYYNHGIVNIKATGSSANLRIFNGCQFYCSGDMRARNYEGVQGSSLICGGELMFSGSNDGTSDASYVGLEAGALVQCGTLNNNGTSWTGPTENGYAVLNIEKEITYLNWVQDAPAQGGYFANNIYVCAGTWSNKPGGNGWETWDAATKFAVIQNATGNGHVTIIEKSTDDKDNLIPASENFVAGVSECTPGFNGKTPDPTPKADVRVIAEDLTVSDNGDFDFNDVVFDVILHEPAGKTTIILRAAGGTLPLKVGGYEVHEAFKVRVNEMVNTGAGSSKDPVTIILDDDYQNANDIPVEVLKGGSWGEMIELVAVKGQVPSKIAVPIDYEWCNERQDIENKYPHFQDYVNNHNISDWYKYNK